MPIGGRTVSVSDTAASEHAAGRLDLQPNPQHAPFPKRQVIVFGVLLFALHAFCMLFRYGARPPAPVIGDEVTINDAAVALSRGQGLIAPSFKDSVFGFDKIYAHFPPVYVYLESLAFRWWGVSVYSLRLTTTVADIVASAAFLLLLYWLIREGLADKSICALAAMLYCLNASLVALHRIARMEPLVELFAIVALWCVLSGIQPRYARSGLARTGWLLVGGVLMGISVATHPEALTAILPMLVIICSPRGGTWRAKLPAIGAFVITPVAIWVAAYGSRSVDALRQMWRVARFTPGPGIYSFAQTFTLEDHRNVGEGMRATLFVLCLTLFLMVVLRWCVLERTRQKPPNSSGPEALRLDFARSFALATVISLALLIWIVGASITRYEAMYPVWLLGSVLVFRGASAGAHPRLLAGVVAAVVLAEMVGIGVYLGRPEVARADSDPHRFDSIVAQIPPGYTVAATPMLWLAFEQQDRPFTLLFWRLDGRETWRRQNSGNPLKQFDAVLIDESFVDDLRFDTPYAAQGRIEHRYVVGSDVVHVFLRPSASE